MRNERDSDFPRHGRGVGLLRCRQDRRSLPSHPRRRGMEEGRKKANDSGDEDVQILADAAV